MRVGALCAVDIDHIAFPDAFYTNPSGATNWIPSNTEPLPKDQLKKKLLDHRTLLHYAVEIQNKEWVTDALRHDAKFLRFDFLSRGTPLHVV